MSDDAEKKMLEEFESWFTEHTEGPESIGARIRSVIAELEFSPTTGENWVARDRTVSAMVLAMKMGMLEFSQRGDPLTAQMLEEVLGTIVKLYAGCLAAELELDRREIEHSTAEGGA